MKTIYYLGQELEVIESHLDHIVAVDVKGSKYWLKRSQISHYPPFKKTIADTIYLWFSGGKMKPVNLRYTIYITIAVILTAWWIGSKIC